MLPKPPPREGALGFLYLPPFRVQGFSVAGEATCVQVPELDVCFDVGICPRAALPSRYACISHGHMDHVGGLAYYCSQRRFQGMGTGTIVCSTGIADDIHAMMAGFRRLERQETPYELIALEHEGTIEIKNNTLLRGFDTEHTAGSMGYVIVERRSKLRDEFVGLPQEKLRELKDRGEQITRTLEIPLIAYVGDTAPGGHLLREDVRNSRVIITECTFFEPGHRDRAKIGMHLHARDIAEWIAVAGCEHMVLVHVSRRTNLAFARQQLDALLSPEQSERVLLLMDHRSNRARYEAQLERAHAESLDDTGD